MKGVELKSGPRPVLPSPILGASAVLMSVIMAVIAVYILLRGHNAPGGGFIGGLVASGAVVLITFAFGARRAKRMLIVHPITLAGIGLALAILSGLPALLSGSAFLTHLWGDLGTELGVLKLGTTYIFDFGVFLVVIGAVSAFFFMFEEG